MELSLHRASLPRWQKMDGGLIPEAFLFLCRISFGKKVPRRTVTIFLAVRIHSSKKVGMWQDLQNSTILQIAGQSPFQKESYVSTFSNNCGRGLPRDLEIGFRSVSAPLFGCMEYPYCPNVGYRKGFLITIMSSCFACDVRFEDTVMINALSLVSRILIGSLLGSSIHVFDRTYQIYNALAL